MTTTIEAELYAELRDRIAHAVVFAEACERGVREVFALVEQIREEEGESDER